MNVIDFLYKFICNWLGKIFVEVLCYYSWIGKFIYGIVIFIWKVFCDLNNVNFFKLIVVDMYRNYIVLIKWMLERLGFI